VLPATPPAASSGPPSKEALQAIAARLNAKILGLASQDTSTAAPALSAQSVPPPAPAAPTGAYINPQRAARMGLAAVGAPPPPPPPPPPLPASGYAHYAGYSAAPSPSTPAEWSSVGGRGGGFSKRKRDADGFGVDDDEEELDERERSKVIKQEAVRQQFVSSFVKSSTVLGGSTGAGAAEGSPCLTRPSFSRSQDSEFNPEENESPAAAKKVRVSRWG
jgi:hypothetical protein